MLDPKLNGVCDGSQGLQVSRPFTRSQAKKLRDLQTLAMRIETMEEGGWWKPTKLNNFIQLIGDDEVQVSKGENTQRGQKLKL